MHMFVHHFFKIAFWTEVNMQVGLSKPFSYFDKGNSELISFVSWCHFRIVKLTIEENSKLFRQKRR